MPPSSRKDRGRTKTSDPKGRVRRGRPKVCIFCTEHIPWVDYKDMNLLRRFMSDRGDQVPGKYGHVLAASTRRGPGHQERPGAGTAPLRGADLGRRQVGRTSGRGPGRPGERPQGDRPSGPPSAAGGAEAAVSIDSDIPVSEETASVDADVLGAGTAPDDGGCSLTRMPPRTTNCRTEKVDHRPPTPHRDRRHRGRNGSPLIERSCD